MDTCSPPKKKFKIENCTLKPRNDMSCVLEIVEEIKDLLDSELSVQPKNINNIPIPKTPVEKVIKPSKIKSPSPEICKKEIQQNCKISVVGPVVNEPTVEKRCKSQQVSTSTTPKQKCNKNEPKFKEKNALFKYGNYNR